MKQVTTTIDKSGGRNILVFDFPNIHLLDSSHHGQCDGMVIFTIKTKTGLPAGTVIPNHAGIIFDDNPVVLTNDVYNTIGTPTSISVMSNASLVDVYPNPVNEELTINTGNDSYNNLTITNSLGQTLITKAITSSQSKVDVQSLPTGLYYLTLKGENGIKTQNFIKL